VFVEIKKFAFTFRKGSKPKFQYVLPVCGKVCRKCWILAVGFKNPNNGRVRSAEALIRKGCQSLPPTISKKGTQLNRSSYARAFMRDFIWKHNQGSPVDTYVPYFNFAHTHTYTHIFYIGILLFSHIHTHTHTYFIQAFFYFRTYTHIHTHILYRHYLIFAHKRTYTHTYFIGILLFSHIHAHTRTYFIQALFDFRTYTHIFYIGSI